MSNRPSGEHKVVTPASGVVTSSQPALDSGPVIEVVAERSKPVAAEPARPRRKRADSSSVQIADTGHIDDYITHEPRRRGLWVAVVLLVVAGSAAAAYFLGYLDNLLGREPGRVATVLRGDAAVVAPIPDAAPPIITREVALERAQAALRAQLTAPPRVQQLAAAALARTGDAQALDILAAAIPKEPSDLAKIELAYQLARGGDKRGIESLQAAASPTKRDSKHEAGRRFALLGDPRAVKILEGSLPFPQFRIGVAEQLAYLAEPRALKILDDVRADPKALPSEKARAAIALGWAGRADVAPALRELLAETRDNAYAAAALANLKDPAARPVLEQQLGINTLRVRAARGLRQLAPDADVGPLLQMLVGALESEKDTVQVEIAEAILLLAGPPAWSARE
jgi:HEAT repeat protein